MSVEPGLKQYTPPATSIHPYPILAYSVFFVLPTCKIKVSMDKNKWEELELAFEKHLFDALVGISSM